MRLISFLIAIILWSSSISWAAATVESYSVIDLSSSTKKVIVLPEAMDLKAEIEEFKMFRNRYVIFGVYLFTALYYNWLTRYR